MQCLDLFTNLTKCNKKIEKMILVCKYIIYHKTYLLNMNSISLNEYLICEAHWWDNEDDILDCRSHFYTNKILCFAMALTYDNKLINISNREREVQFVPMACFVYVQATAL